jgi:TRAP-type C4-dicarboxylate transport system permease small subunit
MMQFLNRFDSFIHRALEVVCSLFLALMVGFTIYTVMMRYVFENPPVWGDLLTVLSNIWLMFIALSLTARDNEHIALNLIYEKLPDRVALYIRQFWKLMIMLVGLFLIIYGIELVEGMRGKYWEMWHFEFTAQGIEFKENYMPKKYAVMILPIAGFLTTIGAAICFLKKV